MFQKFKNHTFYICLATRANIDTIKCAIPDIEHQFYRENS